jgi:Glycosyltransferases involved in cell wall biogenesis
MQTEPLVSVIIPCFNAEAYIGAAIESALSQTYENVEVIVVDDGSSDKSAEIIEKFVSRSLVTLLRHPNNENRGVSFTRKLGIEAAKGEYIALLDADDLFENSKLRTQVELLEGNPDCVLCHTAVTTIYDAPYDGSFENWFNFSDEILKYELQATDNYLKNNRICNSSVLIRKCTIASIPFGFKQLFQFEDFLTWSLASQRGSFLYTPQRLTRYRFHLSSASSRFLANSLINSYSYLEFYLSLLAKTMRPEIKNICIEHIYSTLNSLHKEYVAGDLEINTDELQPFHTISDAFRKISTLESQRNSLTSELIKANNSIVEQGLVLKELRDHLDACETFRRQVLTSWSWRLSSPLRLIGRFFTGKNA